MQSLDISTNKIIEGYNAGELTDRPLWGAWLRIFTYGDMVLQDPIYTRTEG